MIKAIHGANYIVWYANLINKLDKVNNVKLQKILYYVEVNYIRKYGTQLFEDEIAKWKHGPVYLDVYSKFKSYGANPIKATEFVGEIKSEEDFLNFLEIHKGFDFVKPDVFSKEQEEIIQSTVEDLVDRSVFELINKTTQCPHWIKDEKKIYNGETLFYDKSELKQEEKSSENVESKKENFELTFLGTGGAFNTSLGNTSAYFKADKTLFLIDCGNSVYNTLIEKNILNQIEDVVVLITHSHSDHIGSLADLIFYGYFVKGEAKHSRVTVISPKDTNVTDILLLMGVDDSYYNYIDLKSKTHLGTKGLDLYVEPIKVSHSPFLECYAYFIEHNGQIIYYSGDSVEIPQKALSLLYSGELHKLYQDVSSLHYEGRIHLSFKDLSEIIGKNRNKVYCMHLDEGFDRQQALKMGFNIAGSE